ncbi:hypothetical protein [Mucilaginibacter humi]|nr:hypothetical protein [Mucilaginibacter humi]
MPATKAALAGKVTFKFDAVMAIVLVLAVTFQLASTAFTITLN